MSESEIEIPALPKPTAKTKLRHFTVDRRLQLSTREMAKFIEDPSPLLRKSERAPPTRELMLRRQLEIEDENLTRLFFQPSIPRMNPKYVVAYQRSLMTTEALKRTFPEGEVTEEEIGRGESRTTHDAYPEWGAGDYIPPAAGHDEDLGGAAYQPQYEEVDREHLPEETGAERDTSQGSSLEARITITARTAKMRQWLKAKFGDDKVSPFPVF